jgi:hypothetical protein
MTEANIQAVREIRAQADRLRLECIKAAEGSTLLHIAYGKTVIDSLPNSQASLLNKLNKIN